MADSIDYAALAKKAGAISSTPATTVTAGPPDVDYAALAKQAGAVSSTPAPAMPKDVLDDPNNKLVGESNGIPVYRHDHPEGGEGFVDAAWEGLGGKNLMDLMAGASRTKEGADRTKNAIKGLIEGFRAEPGRVWRELSETGGSLMKGDLPAAAYHAAGSVPLAGSAAQQVAVDFDNGDYSRGFGHAFGLLAPFLMGALPKKINVGGMKSKLNAVGQKAVAFADANNIPISAGTRTGSKALQGIERVLQSDVGSAGIASEARDATTQALQQTGEKLADRALPVPVSPEDAGGGVLTELKNTISRLDQQANGEYNTFRKAEQYPQNVKKVPTGRDANGRPVYENIALPVDMRPVKAAVRPIYDRYRRTMPTAQARASEGLKALENILNEGDFKAASIAEMDLGAIKQAARSEIPELRDVSSGLAAKAVTELDGAIQGAVQNAYWPGHTPGAAPGTNSPALRSLLQGRKFTAEKWDVGDTLRSLGKNNIEDLEPVQVFRSLTWEKDAGVQRLREVANRAPNAMPAIGRAYVEGLLDTAMMEGDFGKTQAILNKWGSLGAESKKVLFRDPALIKDLDNFFMLAKKVHENPNPSGTAATSAVISHVATFTTAGGLMLFSPEAAGAVLAGGAARIIGARQLAKLLFKPGAAQALTNGMKVPLGAPGSILAYNQLLKLAGDDAKPVDEKK